MNNTTNRVELYNSHTIIVVDGSETSYPYAAMIKVTPNSDLMEVYINRNSKRVDIAWLPVKNTVVIKSRELVAQKISE